MQRKTGPAVPIWHKVPMLQFRDIARLSRFSSGGVHSNGIIQDSDPLTCTVTWQTDTTTPHVKRIPPRNAKNHPITRPRIILPVPCG